MLNSPTVTLYTASNEGRGDVVEVINSVAAGVSVRINDDALVLINMLRPSAQARVLAHPFNSFVDFDKKV